MSTSDIIVIHPEDEKLKALKAFLKALEIKFEVIKNQPYNKKFVNTIIKGDEDIKKGNGKKITLDQLDDLWK
ncbi:MAG: hypothetical protein DRJ09_07620 [Bacteroidetes bacterium]|nr:MAG: hypothetical protein DRJ09_07620 [Bacteroidota bacterium]